MILDLSRKASDGASSGFWPRNKSKKTDGIPRMTADDRDLCWNLEFEHEEVGCF